MSGGCGIREWATFYWRMSRKMMISRVNSKLVLLCSFNRGYVCSTSEVPCVIFKAPDRCRSR
jgi:hypothetical protein